MSGATLAEGWSLSSHASSLPHQRHLVPEVSLLSDTLELTACVCACMAGCTAAHKQCGMAVTRSSFSQVNNPWNVSTCLHVSACAVPHRCQDRQLSFDCVNLLAMQTSNMHECVTARMSVHDLYRSIVSKCTCHWPVSTCLQCTTATCRNVLLHAYQCLSCSSLLSSHAPHTRLCQLACNAHQQANTECTQHNNELLASMKLALVPHWGCICHCRHLVLVVVLSNLLPEGYVITFLVTYA